MDIRFDASSIAAPGLMAPSGAGPAHDGGFMDALQGAIGEVEQSQRDARTSAADLLTGGKGDVHTVALNTQRAELSLELFQQVRNKFVQAYQEIMRMQL